MSYTCIFLIEHLFESLLSGYNKLFTNIVTNPVLNSYLYNLLLFLDIHFIYYIKLPQLQFKLNRESGLVSFKNVTFFAITTREAFDQPVLREKRLWSGLHCLFYTAHIN